MGYEKKLQNAILMSVGRRSDVRVWRNNVGRARPLSNPDTVVQYGRKGMADILGIIKSASGFGRFLSIEVKGPETRTTPEQRSWRKMVNEFGGIGIEVRLHMQQGEDVEQAIVREVRRLNEWLDAVHILEYADVKMKK